MTRNRALHKMNKAHAAVAEAKKHHDALDAEWWALEKAYRLKRDAAHQALRKAEAAARVAEAELSILEANAVADDSLTRDALKEAIRKVLYFRGTYVENYDKNVLTYEEAIVQYLESAQKRTGGFTGLPADFPSGWKDVFEKVRGTRRRAKALTEKQLARVMDIIAKHCPRRTDADDAADSGWGVPYRIELTTAGTVQAVK